jgi:hypothetical protein
MPSLIILLYLKFDADGNANADASAHSYILVKIVHHMLVVALFRLFFAQASSHMLFIRFCQSFAFLFWESANWTSCQYPKKQG